MARKTKRKHTLCDLCTGVCCRYITQEIPTPVDYEDFDSLYWMLAHEKVSIYCDDEDKWHLQVDVRCKKLTKDNKCAIYQNRPGVCRDHLTTECEMSDLEEGFDYKLQFVEPEEMAAYIRARFTNVEKGLQRIRSRSAKAKKVTRRTLRDVT